MDLMQSLIASKLLGGGGGSEPVLKTKTVYRNGTYSAIDDEADGYSSITVETQGISKTVQSNGVYKIGNDSEYAIGYNTFTVNIPEAPVRTTSLTATENGNYSPGPATEYTVPISTIPDNPKYRLELDVILHDYDIIKINYTNTDTGTTGTWEEYFNRVNYMTLPNIDWTQVVTTDSDHYLYVVDGGTADHGSSVGTNLLLNKKGFTITSIKIITNPPLINEVTVAIPDGTNTAY